ncbi:MAG: site-specific DNA-methyltransferase [Promethearchaeota archaeon]|nr:MAG: site-specific DNA-methyltransferase [Candidatus Lokiarchaeota archaeon]
MNTTHQFFFKNSKDMSEIASNSVDLVVTSPPYPMIEMWDSLFCKLNPRITKVIEEGDGKNAFHLMHDELNKIWKECTRILKSGGIACINIGDATRKVKNTFQLYPNHIIIADFFHKNGFISLPSILWRKPTNAPNKFMGSGMLPPNAYVTLEHEYILIFRKGKRKLNLPPKLRRRYNSAYFWEERNKWFSDVWTDFKGTNQSLNDGLFGAKKQMRERSGAFPLELPFRLINMYSLYGDTILDPFWGTGTTTLAAMVCGRNSIGYEVNSDLGKFFDSRFENVVVLSKDVNKRRLRDHSNFINQQEKVGKELKHENTHYGFKVTTSQEKELLLYNITKIIVNDNTIKLIHDPYHL